MTKAPCLLLCVLFFSLNLIAATQFYLLDFVAVAFALTLAKSKKRTIFWLFGLNLFVLFTVLSYILNGDLLSAKIVAIRTNLILLLVLSLFLGRDAFFITKGLYALRAPQKLLAVMLINSRLFLDLRLAFSRIPLTLKARGVRQQTSLFFYKMYANLIGKNIINSLDRSLKIYKTMRVRGYTNRLDFLPSQRANWREIVLLLLVILSVIFRIFQWI